MTIALKNKTEFKFGDYAIIEQKRHGVPNDMFVHKVIDQLRSNTWVDVPVQSPATETMHDEMEDICLCICCGVDQTEVRRYRVKDMRRHSPVSAVTDEKKGSTITLQAVNELIASLEGAGELSIKETKVMDLAKAYQQLAAENVALKAVFSEGEIPSEAVDAFMETAVMDHDWNETSEWSWVENETEVIHAVLDALKPDTPATARIVAGIKADGVEEFIGRLQQHVDEGDFVGDEVAVIVGAIDCGKEFFEQLREGDGK